MKAVLPEKVPYEFIKENILPESVRGEQARILLNGYTNEGILSLYIDLVREDLEWVMEAGYTPTNSRVRVINVEQGKINTESQSSRTEVEMEIHFQGTDKGGKLLDCKLGMDLPIACVYGLKDDVLKLQCLQENKKNHMPAKTVEDANATALKVIGLLMLHLNKGKYTNNGKPNKNQFKELLLELAKEHKINPYGLNKADDRILRKALTYLDEQKID